MPRTAARVSKRSAGRLPPGNFGSTPNRSRRFDTANDTDETRRLSWPNAPEVGRAVRSENEAQIGRTVDRAVDHPLELPTCHTYLSRHRSDERVTKITMAARHHGSRNDDAVDLESKLDVLRTLDAIETELVRQP